MEIKFNWLSQINPSSMATAEEKIKKDIEESEDFKICHDGSVLISISSTDPLEVSVKGNVKCQCGKVIATFTGAGDGSKLNYNMPN